MPLSWSDPLPLTDRNKWWPSVFNHHRPWQPHVHHGNARATSCSEATACNCAKGNRGRVVIHRTVIKRLLLLSLFGLCVCMCWSGNRPVKIYNPNHLTTKHTMLCLHVFLNKYDSACSNNMATKTSMAWTSELCRGAWVKVKWVRMRPV